MAKAGSATFGLETTCVGSMVLGPCSRSPGNQSRLPTPSSVLLLELVLSPMLGSGHNGLMVRQGRRATVAATCPPSRSAALHANRSGWRLCSVDQARTRGRGRHRLAAGRPGAARRLAHTPGAPDAPRFLGGMLRLPRGGYGVATVVVQRLDDPDRSVRDFPNRFCRIYCGTAQNCTLASRRAHAMPRKPRRRAWWPCSGR